MEKKKWVKKLNCKKAFFHLLTLTIYDINQASKLFIIYDKVTMNPPACITIGPFIRGKIRLVLHKTRLK